jgi:hypothetical protein
MAPAVTAADMVTHLPVAPFTAVFPTKNRQPPARCYLLVYPSVQRIVCP